MTAYEQTVVEDLGQEGGGDETGGKTVNWLVILLVVAMIAVVSGGVVLFRNLGAGEALSEEATVADLGKIMVLPENEVPSIATVVDPSKLAEQIFFAQAAEGDKLVLYPEAKKAILYRPSTNMVVEVMPLILDLEEGGQATDFTDGGATLN